VNGYRLAMIATGSGALLLSEVLPWRAVYAVVAAGMLVGVVATVVSREPPSPEGRPLTLREAVVDPFAEFARRAGWGGLAVLGFVAIFKLPDAVGNLLTMPLLLDGLGFAKAEVAVLRELLGLGLSILGALVGGPLVARWGIRRSLWLFGVLQAVSNLGFCWLAAEGRSLPVLVAVVAVESLCGGLVAAGFVACLMALCDRRYSATQFALFTSLAFLVGQVVGANAGALVPLVGYAAAFALSAAAGLPGLLLLPGLPLPRSEDRVG
jgi:PAT family beta-lactamase induction signal transducer AmpG